MTLQDDVPRVAELEATVVRNRNYTSLYRPTPHAGAGAGDHKELAVA